MHPVTYILPFNTSPFWTCVSSSFLKTIVNGLPLPGYQLRIRTRANRQVCAVQVITPTQRSRTGGKQLILAACDGLLNFSSTSWPAGRFTLDQVRAIVSALPLDPHHLAIHLDSSGFVATVQLVNAPSPKHDSKEIESRTSG